MTRGNRSHAAVALLLAAQLSCVAAAQAGQAAAGTEAAADGAAGTQAAADGAAQDDPPPVPHAAKVLRSDRGMSAPRPRLDANTMQPSSQPIPIQPIIMPQIAVPTGLTVASPKSVVSPSANPALNAGGASGVNPVAVPQH